MKQTHLESAAANYLYLRGLLTIPLGLLLIAAALSNWGWGPFADAWAFWLAAGATGAACFGITRFYNARYGRITPTRSQEARTAFLTIVGAVVFLAGALLARSEADWSLDLPVNPIAASFGLFMLIYYAVTVGLKPHHWAVFGTVLAAGALPVWGNASLDDVSNVGLILAGVAAMVAGVLDHLALARAIPPLPLEAEGADAGR